MNRPLLLATAVLAAGCYESEEGAQLMVPDRIELHWSDAFNGEQDDIAALVPVDVMVYEGVTGEPLDFVDIEIAVDGGIVVSPEDVEPVDPNVEGAVWDAWRDEYVVFRDGADPAPTLVEQTDDDGLVRVYVYVDSFPLVDATGDSAVDGDFAPVPVLVSMGITAESFELVPR